LICERIECLSTLATAPVFANPSGAMDERHFEIAEEDRYFCPQDFDLNDRGQNALRLEISLKKPYRITDRLCSNGCIKCHRVSASFTQARTERAWVERLCFTVDEEH
jgi:hypothetical protein